MENTELKFWGQVFPVSAYGLADGSIKLHIQDGIAPFKVELKVNHNVFRVVENIPAAEFNYATYSGVNYADTNCEMYNLPPGDYSLVAWDSSDPPQDVRGFAGWNAVSPPYATLNGTCNAVGLSTTVEFEYGETIPYQYVAQYGIVSGVETVTCSLQLSAGGYNNTSILVPGTTYHYRIKATNVNGTAYGEDMTFTTPVQLPIVQTLPATNVG